MPFLQRIDTRPLLLATLIAMLFGSILAPSVAADYPPGDPPATVEYGDTGTLPGYSLRVVEVSWDAEGLLRAFDPDMPHVSDTVWMMVRLEAVYTGSGTGIPADDLAFSLRHSDEGTFGQRCARWPFPPDSITLAPGETARFNLCFEAPLWMVTPCWVMGTDGTEITIEPEERIELIARTNLLTDQWPVTFALGTPGSEDTAPTPCGCLPPDAETPVT